MQQFMEKEVQDCGRSQIQYDSATSCSCEGSCVLGFMTSTISSSTGKVSSVMFCTCKVSTGIMFQFCALPKNADQLQNPV